jgi:hypothetical protein
MTPYSPYGGQQQQPTYHQAPPPPPPQRQMIPSFPMPAPQRAVQGLEQMLSAAATGYMGDEIYSQNLPIQGVSNHRTGDYSELQCREDREFAQKIVEALYQIEPGNGKVTVSTAMGQMKYYIWAEEIRRPVDLQLLNMLYSLPYPKHGVSGLVMAQADPPHDNIPFRLITAFVPQHISAAQSFQPQLAAPRMMIEAPAVRISRVSSSESSSRSESPVRQTSNEPGFLKRILGVAADPPRKEKQSRRAARRRK